MIDEWFEDKIDRLCIWAPRYFGPRMTRFTGTRIGWRLTLYASAIKRNVWGMLTSIKWIEEETPQEEAAVLEAADPALDKLDPKTRQDVQAWNEDLKAWTKRQEEERKKWKTPKARLKAWWAGRHERALRSDRRWEKREAEAEQRAQKQMLRLMPAMRAIENGRFSAMLLYTALCLLGLLAPGGGGMAYMAAASLCMWLAVSMEIGYAPIAGRVRQRYLASVALRAGSFLMLLPMYFEAYLRGGVRSNVVLQSAMLVMLFAHGLLTLTLVAFNKRQPLFLRTLAGVVGVIPALCAAAAIAWAVTCVALPPMQAAFSVIGALGAVMAFISDRASTLHDLGGIRLRYTPVWTSLFMELGFLMMLLGSWIAG